MQTQDQQQTSLTPVKQQAKTPQSSPLPPAIAKQDKANISMLQERCRQLCLSTFFPDTDPARSLGITSSIAGEGKTFLAAIMAKTLANDTTNPVTLLECNWEHPDIHTYFEIPATPGLAEWLRGECQLEDIRYIVGPNLTVIPAGNGRSSAVKQLQQMRQHGLRKLFNTPDDFFIVDLPPVVSSAYGKLAATLVESLVIVVRSGETTDLMIAETTEQLKNLPVQGVILNQMVSKIPRWLQRLL
ncbi:Mrp family chromosome partitioning ATPase [Thermosporothrix hazakensis]|jgi:Mrp family chromosome partitioning ATPase|uniref:Mrp family chromosome partitioning ATPase n=2 Tax=Thermosporothrix TaxID=768650 RepID=A0A326UCA1_THEHA|nr:CpsD/CapB family tyrosine-protein kinase [Thermosporothrix hazakensis]PZW35956.1 Mrp family chromosome partitioning ATPase [Thermosporothrix hazakensis]BBH88426.1 hypothetical protein KTC_31770 [Thermosporothrix sp. COM3]GCE46612.1 hypothetical protein KTH_14810 [Thermosporothrix hazakensis]